jgi:arginyl-tRNA synthetase
MALVSFLETGAVFDFQKVKEVAKMINEEVILAVEEILHKILEEVGLQRPEAIRIIIEHPTNLMYGDYSTNIAMQLAKILKRSPISIANEVKEKLLCHVEINTLFYKIEVVAPGFINLYLDWEKWALKMFNVPLISAQSRTKVIIEHQEKENLGNRGYLLYSYPRSYSILDKGKQESKYTFPKGIMNLKFKSIAF